MATGERHQSIAHVVLGIALDGPQRDHEPPLGERELIGQLERLGDVPVAPPRFGLRCAQGVARRDRGVALATRQQDRDERAGRLVGFGMGCLARTPDEIEGTIRFRWRFEVSCRGEEQQSPAHVVGGAPTLRYRNPPSGSSSCAFDPAVAPEFDPVSRASKSASVMSVSTHRA